MGEFIANEGIILSFNPPTVSGEITITSSASATTKVGGSGVYRGPLTFSCSALLSPDCGSVTPGVLPSGVINPTAIASKADGQFVIREGDESEQLFSTGAKMPGSPDPVTCTISFTVKVSFAGQIGVKGD